MLPLIRTASETARAPIPPLSGRASSALLETAPGLRYAAERVLQSTVKTLQAMAGHSTIVSGAVVNLGTLSMKEVVLNHRPENIAMVLLCESCTLLASLDATLVYTTVELLAGGDGSEPYPDVPRAATAVDQHYGQTLIAIAAGAIETEWRDKSLGKVHVARLENGIALDTCGPRVHQVGVVTFALTLFGLRGNLQVLLPPSLLRTFGEDGEPAVDNIRPPDPAWSNLLRHEVAQAPLRLDAYLDIQELPLAAIARLRVGQLLAIRASARNNVALVCDGQPVFRGELGRDENHYALRIDEKVARGRDRLAARLQNRPGPFETRR